MATPPRIRLLLALPVLLALAGCGDPDPGAGTGPEVLEVTAEPAAVQDEDLALVRDLREGDQGRIWVLSGHPPFVRIYDGNGTRISAFGEPGGGPGEFGVAWALVPPPPGAPEEAMGVFDNRRGTIRTFAPDGTVVAEERLDTFVPLPPDVRQVFFGDLAWVWRVEGGLLQDQYPPVPDAGPMPMQQASDFWIGELVFTPDGEGSEPETRLVLSDVLELPADEPRVPRPLAAGPLWDLCPGGELILHTGAASEVVRVGLDGQVLSRHRVDLPLEELSEGLLAEWMISVISQLQPMPGDTPEAMRERAEAIAAQAAPHLDPHVPPTRLRCDPQGRAWIQLFDMEHDRRGYAREWVVLDGDGDVIAHVTFPAGFHPVRFGSERVLGVLRDELDVETVGWVQTPALE